MSELISRQAVMDATKTVMKDVLDSLPTTLEDGEEVYDVRTSELDLILGINKALQNAIKALPSETHEIRTETHGVCSDAISRQAVIDAIEHVTWYHQNRNGQMVSGANSDEHQAWYKAEDVYEAIEVLPSAEPKTGEWIEDAETFYKAVNEYGGGVDENTPYFTDDIACSKCLAKFSVIDNETERFDFCPNCGADMRGGDAK